MSTEVTDRNLLWGLVAVQTGMLSPSQMLEAVSILVTDKSQSVADHCLLRHLLDRGQKELVDALVAEHLRKHGGVAADSLAAMSSLPPIRESLEQLGDPELTVSAGHLPRHSPSNGTHSSPSNLATVASEPRFRVLRPHAEGGLGLVYVARDAELGRDVALKEIRPKFVHEVQNRARFTQEAIITGRLEHPGIVPVYGLGQYADGRPYYAMRFVRGDNLKEVIEQFHNESGGRPFAASRLLELRQLFGRFIDVCDAIEFAHSRGVLHRDLKPGNIMLGKHGETLVIDWGLAKADQSLEESAVRVEFGGAVSSGSAPTEFGSAIGTPAYMSPEQAAGKLDELGPSSDVYSLGATLYCLLTGQAPFASGNRADIISRVQSGNFPKPSAIQSTLPAALEAICLKAMALRAESRYSSARALAQDVENWLGDQRVSAWSESRIEKTLRWLRQHPRSVASAVVAAIMLTLGFAGLAGVVTWSKAVLADKNAQLAEANARERTAAT